MAKPKKRGSRVTPQTEAAKTIGRRSQSSSRKNAKKDLTDRYQEEREEFVLGQPVAYLATLNQNGRETLREYGTPPFLDGTLKRNAKGRWSVGYNYTAVAVAPAAAQVFKHLSEGKVRRIRLLMSLIEGFTDDAKQRHVVEKHDKYKLLLEQMNERAVALGEEIANAINRHPDDLIRAISALNSVRHRELENELLLAAIAKTARKVGRVPVMKEVLETRGGRAHDGLAYDKTTFSKALKRIGFDWLPKARRSSRMT